MKPKIEGLTGDEDTGGSDPCEPGHFVECSNTGEDEGTNGSNGSENRTAGAVGRDGVQGDRSTNHSRSSDHDPRYCSAHAKGQIEAERLT
jgi:hypothetical protein